ncbi:Uu.00g111520.m01.CDS01 [Anthostomella pinea]|uniref:Uu.00g111520.m01.CDS01 n=1 Tax=Anthostomella pinea TaxID=933095 RepID=A0AAI8VG60_9PEZI|nr:Uu.00g111520.m01.CDS01 [Anthostomella pinea]
MKSILLVAGMAALTTAQLAGLPSCALPCITSAIAAAGCGLSDIACQCGPAKTVIYNNATPCLLGSCKPADLAQAQSVGAALCSSFGGGQLFLPTATTTPTGDEIWATTLPSTGDDILATRMPWTGDEVLATATGHAITTMMPIPLSILTESSSSMDMDGMGGMNMTSGGTLTATHIGVTPTLTKPVTGSLTVPTGNAAATPAMAGAGVLAGLLGVVAAL